jgi:hypothetical protein
MGRRGLELLEPLRLLRNAMDYLRLKILVDTARNSDPDSRYKLGRWCWLCQLTR